MYQVINNNTRLPIFHCTPSFSGELSEYLSYILITKQNHPCQRCQGIIKQHIAFLRAPPLIMFGLCIKKCVELSNMCELSIDNRTYTYTLRGIVYFGSAHFTSRIFMDGKVWFHDGITTKQKCFDEGDFYEFSNQELLECNEKFAVLVIYALD